MNMYKRIIMGEILNIKIIKIPCLWLVENDPLNSVIRPAGRGSIIKKVSNAVKNHGQAQCASLPAGLKQLGSFGLNIDWEQLPCI